MARARLGALLALGLLAAPGEGTVTLIVLPSTTLAVGTRNFGPVTIPLGVTGFEASVDRTMMTSPTLSISWSLELSTDGGATFLPWGGAGTVGGILTNPKTGLPVTTSSFGVTLPGTSDGTWQLRGQITVNEIVVTAVNVRLLP